VAGRPDGQVTLIERDKNMGFITSVNTAFDIIQGDPGRRDLPVILLNTDAFVPQGWASRLIAPLQENSDVASVTPMSNDAEIFSVSAICARQTLQAGMGDAIDAVARTLSPLHATAEAPTGVGFCMAIAPAFLAQKPQFDTVFGKGYGEEVDWCQKTRALNGRHLGIGTLFVEHKGGGSFGTETKHALIARNNKIVSQRYPGFDRKVQDFITVDPLRGPRLALALAWAGTISSNKAVPIYLAHSLGGGAENWLQTQISELTAQGLPAIVLRIGGNTRWQVEVWSSGGVTAGQTDNFGLVERLLKPLNNRRIVYSCGVGDRDPVELPAILMKLRRGSQDRLEVLFHDYFPVSPSFTLLDSSGQYRGVPSLRSPDTAHTTLRPDSSIVDLDVWQAAWGGLLHAADTIVTFSTSSAKILFGVWPELRDRIDVRPHSLGALPPHLNTPDRTTLTLGVLGNIAPHKGAATVTALAALSKAERGGSMVLIGNIDPTYSLHRNCTMHGNYTPADIPALVAHYGITHWLIPSIWPETFSYTTHEALATGLPVLAFDIGAQGDAVRRAPNGCPVRYDPDGDTIAPLLTTFTDDHGKTR
jgi:glycosyltransferase involved in cell wall biosynthesis